jgi:hypothetical protein
MYREIAPLIRERAFAMSGEFAGSDRPFRPQCHRNYGSRCPGVSAGGRSHSAATCRRRRIALLRTHWTTLAHAAGRCPTGALFNVLIAYSTTRRGEDRGREGSRAFGIASRRCRVKELWRELIADYVRRGATGNLWSEHIASSSSVAQPRTAHHAVRLMAIGIAPHSHSVRAVCANA